MRRWFLSYHSPDEALAERLKAAIERKDEGAKVFFAPADLRAGGRWAPALAEAIDKATTFVLLVTDKEVGRWQQVEYEAAFDKHVNSPDFPVVLMLLEGQTAPRLSFLKQLHWIVTADPASEKDVGRLIEAVACDQDAKPGERWRYTSPYRGLYAMEEKDSDFFFGREHETIEVLKILATERAKIPVLLGNSGVGKSSLAQAGVIAALRHQAWPEHAGADPWPAIFKNSRRWHFLSLKPGAEPIKALVEPFLRTWRYDATDPEWEERRNGWVDRLLDGRNTLRGLLDATEGRHEELGQPKPPGFFLYVDQGEELYLRRDERQHRRFSQLLAQAVGDPRLIILMSMRSDFLGALQNDEPLFAVHRKIDVPPLREAELCRVIREPAKQLSARFDSDQLIDVIMRRTLEDSVKDVGALPLLSYTLDDMWTTMVQRGDGVLRLPAAAFELGGVLAERANSFLAQNPAGEDTLRRVFMLRLATVREDGVPTRRRAPRSEFTDDEWQLVCELADHPNRLLITATPEGGEAYAEVAHEALFRRWGKLSEWVAGEREFLAWRNVLEANRRTWDATAGGAKADALLMGLQLKQARNWLSKRGADIQEADRRFIELSRKAAQRRIVRVQSIVGTLVAAMAAGAAVWRYELPLKEGIYWFTDVRVLTAEQERALMPGKSFKECTNCPEMLVVRAGTFLMGSPPGQGDDVEHPQHEVTIALPFAVGKYELTLDQWRACATHGDCDPRIGSRGGERGQQPMNDVSWDDAQTYVKWLSRVTGRHYRLLTEAEWEYAARGGTVTAYSFGDDEATLDQYGWYDANSDSQSHSVGTKKPNAFGLFDMHGNVWEWVEDCRRDNYDKAPDCAFRVFRGGAWEYDSSSLRSAFRAWGSTVTRTRSLGFRVGRTLGS